MHKRKTEALVALYAALPKNQHEQKQKKKTVLHGEHATFTLIIFDWLLVLRVDWVH